MLFLVVAEQTKAAWIEGFKELLTEYNITENELLKKKHAK